MRRAVDLAGKAMRETGHALDRVAMRMTDNEAFRETLSRHRQIMPLKDKVPSVAANAWVAPNASVIGNVSMHEGSSVWYKAMVRGDKYAVKIGPFSNVQDHSTVQCVIDENTAFPPNTVIGSFVTVGHGAKLTSCLVGDQCLIGQGSVVSEGCTVGSGSIIGAGAVLPPDTHVPPKQLWAGNPAKFMRDVTADELSFAMQSAKHYSSISGEHKAEYAAFHAKYDQ